MVMMRFRERIEEFQVIRFKNEEDKDDTERKTHEYLSGARSF